MRISLLRVWQPENPVTPIGFEVVTSIDIEETHDFNERRWVSIFKVINDEQILNSFLD
jgi:hypothetical protein